MTYFYWCIFFQTFESFNLFFPVISFFKCWICKLWLQRSNPVASYFYLYSVISPLTETTGDPSLKATDSSAGVMQDGSDKHHKKVRLLDLVASLSFTSSALPRCVLTQLQSTGYLSLYHGFKWYKLLDSLWTLLNSLLVLFILEIYYTWTQNASETTDAMLYCRGFPIIVFTVILVAVRPFQSAFYFYCLSALVSVFFMSLNSQNIFSCFNFTPQSRSPTWNLYCILAHRGSYKSHCFHTSGLINLSLFTWMLCCFLPGENCHSATLSYSSASHSLRCFSAAWFSPSLF